MASMGETAEGFWRRSPAASSVSSEISGDQKSSPARSPGMADAGAEAIRAD